MCVSNRVLILNPLIELDTESAEIAEKKGRVSSHEPGRSYACEGVGRFAKRTSPAGSCRQLQFMDREQFFWNMGLPLNRVSGISGLWPKEVFRHRVGEAESE